jgi:hypothetical protein
MNSQLATGVRKTFTEVDIDMENVEAGVYLWATLLTDRSSRLAAVDGFRALTAGTRSAGTAKPRSLGGSGSG